MDLEWENKIYTNRTLIQESHISNVVFVTDKYSYSYKAKIWEAYFSKAPFMRKLQSFLNRILFRRTRELET